MNTIKCIRIKNLKFGDIFTFNCLNYNCLHSSVIFQNDKKGEIDNKEKDKGKNESSHKSKRESPLKKLLEDAASFEDMKSSNTEQKWATLPYGETAKIRKQGDFYKKEKEDSRETSIILFPGQGSHYVGMGKDLMRLPIVKDLFELANHILGYNLLKLCLEGPKDKLQQTKYSQPAIVVCSLAALQRLKEEQPNAIDNCIATAGMSLGEITALVFAGALDFEGALQLVKIRAEAMQLACERYKGGMVRVVYSSESELKQACVKAKEWARKKGDEYPECSVANYLFPYCKFVAGSISALDYLEKNANEFKLKKIGRLPLAGGFHSSLMASAVEPFRETLNKSRIEDPIITVHSNVDGMKYRNAEHIRMQLPEQIVAPVKWEQTMYELYDRDQVGYFPKTFECGPGNALKAILKECNAKAWDHCLSIQA